MRFAKCLRSVVGGSLMLGQRSQLPCPSRASLSHIYYEPQSSSFIPFFSFGNSPNSSWSMSFSRASVDPAAVACQSSGCNFQKRVPIFVKHNFCTAGENEGGKDNDGKQSPLKKRVEELRELKEELERMEKKFDSYFTVEYALEMTKKGFVDSDEEYPLGEPDTSDLEIRPSDWEGPSSHKSEEESIDENDDDS